MKLSATATVPFQYGAHDGAETVQYFSGIKYDTANSPKLPTKHNVNVTASL